MSRGSTLIVTFDGLRRDRATSELMPNLAQFMDEGADFRNSRSIFPSETRVAVTSTMTGSSPGEHGVVANTYVHPFRPGELFKTMEWDHLEAAAQAGQLVDRLTLGERMAKAGRTMAVVSVASKGASRMMNATAHALGHPVFTMHGPPVSSAELHGLALAKLGDIPAVGTPNGNRTTYTTNVLLEVVYPKYNPDLCVFWMNDPDLTSHFCGITGAETAQAQKSCDDNLGRILAWWRAGNGPENIIVMSDHGQITAIHKREIGIIPAEFGKSSVNGFSGIYLDDPSNTQKAKVVDWLVQQEFCGLVFANAQDGSPIDGALPWSAVRNDHPRNADVGFTLRSTDSSQQYGPEIDQTIFTAPLPVGGGVHGGLNRGELSTVLAAQGPAYRPSFVSTTPCWLPDIAPTILTTMGLSLDGTSGRPMVEALIGDDPRYGTAPEVVTRVLSAERRGHEQHLRQWVIEGKTIVDCGWTSGTGAWKA